MGKRLSACQFSDYGLLTAVRRSPMQVRSVHSRPESRAKGIRGPGSAARSVAIPHGWDERWAWSVCCGTERLHSGCRDCIGSAPGRSAPAA